jgi:hypothetical protein
MQAIELLRTRVAPALRKELGGDKKKKNSIQYLNWDILKA